MPLAPVTDFVFRTAAEGAGALDGAVDEAVALIVTPAGAPAAIASVVETPFAAGNATVPPAVGTVAVPEVPAEADALGAVCGMARTLPPPPPPHPASTPATMARTPRLRRKEDLRT